MDVRRLDGIRIADGQRKLRVRAGKVPGTSYYCTCFKSEISLARLLIIHLVLA